MQELTCPPLFVAPNDNPLLIGYFSPWPERHFHDIRNGPALDARKVAQMPSLAGVWLYADSIYQNGGERWAKVAPPSTTEFNVPDGIAAWICVRNSEGVNWLVPADGSST